MIKNAAPMLDSYTEQVLNTSVPVFVDAPTEYGQFLEAFAQVKAHALRWKRSIIWQLEMWPECLADAEKRLRPLHRDQQLCTARLQAYPADELALKQQQRLRLQMQAILHPLAEIQQTLLDALCSLHVHLEHDALVLDQGAGAGWKQFADLPQLARHARIELSELIQHKQSEWAVWQHSTQRRFDNDCTPSP
ncbi:MAG: hypothetical protein WCC10_11460 [Tumebacillaceae bacterium]